MKCHLVIFALQHLVYQILQFDFCFAYLLHNSLHNDSSYNVALRVSTICLYKAALMGSGIGKKEGEKNPFEIIV